MSVTAQKRIYNNPKSVLPNKRATKYVKHN